MSISSPSMQGLRYILVADSAAAKEEAIVHEYGEPTPGDLICPAKVAIVLLLVGSDEGMPTTGQTHDLADSEVFAPSMVVQSQHGWQSAACTGRLEKYR